MESTNIFMMPSDGAMWKDVALELDAKGLKPTIWLGQWQFDEFVQTNFPDCEILLLKEFPNSIPHKEVRFLPDAEYLTSSAFYRLKNQTFKMMDRQEETRNFGRLERESYFYSKFTQLYSMIVELKIGALVSGEAPHGVANLMAYRICESLGIPSYHIGSNSFVPLLHVQRGFSAEPLPVAGDPKIKEHLEILVESLAQYKHGIPTPLYMENQANFDKQYSFARVLYKYWKHLIVIRIKPHLGATYTPKHDLSVRSRFPWQVNKRGWFAPFLIRKLRLTLEAEYVKQASDVTFSSDRLPKYVYFPLPYEPERTSNPEGGDFYEAVDALMALRNFLPEEIHIFVKEHPSQFSKKLLGFKGRSPYIYQVLKTLPNVKLVSLGTSSAELIEHSEFVCCLTGTAALESALVGKKGIVFGAPWFYSVPGIHVFQNIRSYDAFVSAPTFSLDEVCAAVVKALPTYSIPGSPATSQQAYFKQKFGDAVDGLMPVDQTATLLVDTIVADLEQL